ncbi:MAG: phage major capsid protein [Eubacterium sp.]|nr:phage major capsid protein [Eubacterium sp.]
MFDNIQLEKGLYTASKGFTRALEELDPSENYRGTEYEGLDAFQRQLKRFDIKVTGTDSDTVSKFFETTSSAVLFPEYVSRAVYQGIEEDNTLEKIIAATTKIDALDYRAIQCDAGDGDKALMDVGEGAFIPETVIKTKDSLTQLKKRGRMLVASYEAIKFQRLDMFTIMLKKIGSNIARQQLADAVNVLLNSGAQTVSIAGNDIAYTDIVNLWNSFSPYNMTTMLCSSALLPDLLNMTEFKDSAAGLNFHGTGNMITPLGAELNKVDASICPGIIGLDKSYALEKVQAGEVLTEFDKLIDRQLERAAITTITGFSPIFTDAVKLMS